MNPANSLLCLVLIFSSIHHDSATDDNVAAGYSADHNCLGVDLNLEPCLVTNKTCNYNVEPTLLTLAPYPVCLPSSQCAKEAWSHDVSGQLYLSQYTTVHVQDARSVNGSRLHVRTYMDLGKLGSPTSKNFPICITNDGAKNGNRPLEFAYGTCELDTQPSKAGRSALPLCDLINSRLIKQWDNSGNINVIQCSNGVVTFAPGSDCTGPANQCDINIQFTTYYSDDLPAALYKKFTSKEITIHVEMFQMESYPGATSHIVQEDNEACRQYRGKFKCLGYFYAKMFTFPM